MKTGVGGGHPTGWSLGASEQAFKLGVNDSGDIAVLELVAGQGFGDPVRRCYSKIVIGAGAPG